ncbi:MAG TPA: SRPBCC family protein [Petrimonas sp.]|uniref:SRPBCC family protein n=1 Tax=Petrimonas sp. TaxID=2023866 RepID=UPI0017667569|nr:SRPBCC family protein [Petrimonas sp.]
MTEFTSDIKTIFHNDVDIFRVLSDLSKLDLIKEQISEDKIRDFRFDSDSCSFRVDPVGEVRFRVIEREPSKLVKFKSENLPFDVFLWIQLVQKAEKDTKMKITLRANLNPFIKGMVSKPLEEGLAKISDVIASLPYDKI